MHDPAQAHALDRFLRLYAADLDQGGPRPLEEYQTEIPGHDALLASTYAELTGQAAEASQPLSIDPRMPERLGPYELLEELGRGGQAIVYLARHEEIGQEVALKVLRGLFEPEQFERFLREARIAAKLQHPHLCPVYFAGSENGLPYLVMERIRGSSLSQHIRRANKVDGPYRLELPGAAHTSARAEIEATLQLIENCARAVHEAHLAGVTHRDLNPNNILVRDHGEPSIVDFGLARGESEAVISQSGSLAGTVNYLAPEQLRGTMETDPRIDVWSLGVTLFEALTGTRPFDGPTDAETLRRIQDESLPHPRKLRPELPPELVQCLRTALSRELGHRYQSALAFAEDLERVRERRPILARPAPIWLRGLRLIQRHPALAAVSFLGLAIASVLLYFMLLAQQSENQQMQEKLSNYEESRDAKIELLLAQARTQALRGSPSGSLAKLDEALAQPGEARAKFEVRIRLERARLLLGDLRLEAMHVELGHVARLQTTQSEAAMLQLLELDLRLLRHQAGVPPGRAEYANFAGKSSIEPSERHYVLAMAASTISEALSSFANVLRRRPEHFLAAFYSTQLLSQMPDKLAFRVALAEFDRRFGKHPLRFALEAPAPLSEPASRERYSAALDEAAARLRLRRAALLHPLLRGRF
jgi:serine/threonine protein kinase